MRVNSSQKRKRIAVFLGEMGREYQKRFACEIREIACSKGYDVFVFNNFGAYDSTMLFDMGERDVINIPVFSEFEGVIMLADTFDIDGMEEELFKKIKSQTDCPVVAVRNGSVDTYKVLFDNYGTLYEMTNHFIKDHGFKNICYMSGPLSFDDSRLRLEGFKAAMADAGLEVTDDIIIEGDFWKGKSREAADKFLKAYDGKVEAVICANDYMAIGLIEEFASRGIRVPEDIKFSGFDEVIEGQLGKLSMTTVAIPIHDLASEALSIIEDVNSGKERAKETPLTGNLLIKNSCGCCYDRPNIDVDAYINRISDEYVNVRRSTLFITDIQNQITEEEKLAFINSYNRDFRLKKMYLCLCSDDHKDDNPYSETMILKSIFPFDEERLKNPIIDLPFPRKDILPDEYFDYPEPACFVVFPIHHKNATFGYLVSEWAEKDFTIFIAPYAEGIALAYNDLMLQEQYTELIEIKKQSFIDPLTGISNRRGFEQSLNTLMLQNEYAAKYISFISVDLDNLKTINDSFGHQEGDFAIRTVANVVSEVVGDNNICARVGGDEFYAIILTDDPNIRDKIIDQFYEILNRTCRLFDKGYKIHASIGINTIPSKLISKAFEHLQVADKLMYEAKRRYKEQK